MTILPASGTMIMNMITYNWASFIGEMQCIFAFSENPVL